MIPIYAIGASISTPPAICQFKKRVWLACGRYQKAASTNLGSSLASSLSLMASPIAVPTHLQRADRAGPRTLQPQVLQQHEAGCRVARSPAAFTHPSY